MIESLLRIIQKLNFSNKRTKKHKKNFFGELDHNIIICASINPN